MGLGGHFVSVVMPCLDEEKTIVSCIGKARKAIKKSGYLGEVVVCDNGSIDESARLAKKAGARVVFEPEKGYGSAYLKGISSAKGDWVIIGDSDDTYNFLELPKFINQLQVGYDLVMGSRFKGRIQRGSMPALNRILGTPALNFFLRVFYHLKISDSQSGMRAFTRKAWRKMRLRMKGMEFASEMLVRASCEELRMTEVPISYGRRITPTKLSRFRDAWRHIRFMLLFAPIYLFLIPGSIFMGTGGFLLLSLLGGSVQIFGRVLDVHSMIFASLMSLLGYQIMMLGVYAKVYSWVEGFDKRGLLITFTLRYFRLEKGILLGMLISFVGLWVGLSTFVNWARGGFGSLWAIRPAIFSMTLFVLGIQIIFSSFFLSVLGMERRHFSK